MSSKLYAKIYGYFAIRKNDKSICAYVTVATLQIVSYNSRTHISKQQQVVYCLIIFISSVTCI